MTLFSPEAVKDGSGPAVESVDERLTRLLDEYGAVVRRAIARTCPNHLYVFRDEIEQEARIRLWQALRSERNIADPASYLYRIAVTATIDAIRRVTARRESPLTVVDDLEERPSGPRPVDPGVSPERATVGKEIGRRIQSALAALSDKRRRAVGLHLQGFTPQEIGALLGWTEGKARNLVYRGLDELRNRLRLDGLDHD